MNLNIKAKASGRMVVSLITRSRTINTITRSNETTMLRDFDQPVMVVFQLENRSITNDNP
jgi:hypothetical protein